MAVQNTDFLLVHRDGTDYKTPVEKFLEILPISDLEGVLTFRGTVDSESSLPGGAAIGDIYITTDTNLYYAWNGSEWQDVGRVEVDLSLYITSEEAAATYLPLTGGTLSSTLTGKLIKSVRSGNGYAFEAKPDDSTTTAFIRCDGSASFTGVKVDGTELAKENHTHSGYADASHTHSEYATTDQLDSEIAAQDLALAEFRLEVSDGQTAQDEALSNFKDEVQEFSEKSTDAIEANASDISDLTTRVETEETARAAGDKDLQDQIEKNASDIAAFEASNVHSLNDLEDVQLTSIRNLRRKKIAGDRADRTEELPEVVTEQPVEPDEPTKRTDVVLGYDADTKLWTPHLADYVTLNTTQTINNTKSFTKTIHFDRDGGTYLRFRDANQNERMKFQIDGDDLYRLELAEAKQFKLVTHPDGGDAQQIFRTYADGRCRLSHLADPRSEDEAANRKYVDERSPIFRWKCKASDFAAENLSAGEFFINSTGHIYLHPVTLDGVDLGVKSSAGSISGMNFKQLATVHAGNGNSFYMIVWSEMKFNNSSNNYIKIFMHSEYVTNATTVGNVYHLNIPGFTF